MVTSCGKCELSGSEVRIFFVLSKTLFLKLELRQLLSIHSCLSLSQIKRGELLILVVISCLGNSLLADDSEDLGDGFSCELFTDDK